MRERLRRINYWAVAVVVLLALLGFMTIRDFDWPKIIEDWRPNVVFVSAVVAALSLPFAAWSFARTKTLERQAATLEAWATWSERVRKERLLINSHLPFDGLSTEQAIALATPSAAVTNRHGVELSLKEKSELLDAVLAVLNGLEHIAAGVRCNLYRHDILIMVGGTVIVSNWQRFSPYIEETRQRSVANTKQRRAWIQLERLVDHIKAKRESEDKKAKLRGD